MSPLLKIRAERDQMSAIERRIADFILEEAHLLRDYSSQQLANALKISQSSVVKFSQKLGFKGYPDLKYSIGESIARGDGADANGNGHSAGTPTADDPHAALAGNLWQSKSLAEQETRLINPPAEVDRIAAAIGKAGKVFIIGLGEDGIPARAFAMRLSMLDILTVHHFDAVLMTGLLGEGRGTLAAPIHVGCVVGPGRVIHIDEGGVKVQAFRSTSTMRAAPAAANRVRGIYRPRALT